MQITYDPEGRILYVELNDNEVVDTDSKSIPGVAVFYDAEGNICAVEIDNERSIITEPRKIAFEVLEGLEEDAAISLSEAP